MTDQSPHYLKTWPEYFDAIADGSKNFEVRKNDRNFAVGDILVLQEYIPETKFNEASYTGRELTRRVDYILPGGRFGIKRGYVIMAISAVSRTEARVTCPHCEGKKRFSREITPPWVEDPKYETWDCPVCEGAGEVDLLRAAIYKARGGPAKPTTRGFA